MRTTRAEGPVLNAELPDQPAGPAKPVPPAGNPIAPPQDGVDPAGPRPSGAMFDSPPRTGGAKSGGYTQAQADRDAKTLYDATKGGLTGWGTDEDAIFRTLEGKSTSDIDLLRRSYRDHYEGDLDTVLRKELGGGDRERLEKLLKGTPGKAPAETPPPPPAGEDAAARLKKAVDGVGTDEGAIRDVLKDRSKPEIDELARVYQQRYGHDLRGRLKDELGGRDEVELVDQMFDKGKIDTADPNANVERLRRLRELQDVERGVGGWVTGKIQKTIKGESDEQRLERNIQRAQQAAASGDTERAGRLLGHAEGDLDSFRTAKDSAAEAAATGAAVVASTAVVIGTAGAATPLVVAGAAALAGGTASAGAYAAVQGDAADPTDIARQAAIGAAAGATAGVGAPVSAAGRTAIATAGRQGALQVGEQAAGAGMKQAILQGAREGARAGAAGGAVDGAVGRATERETWEDGVGRGAARVVGSAVTGAAAGTVLGGATGAGVRVGQQAWSRGVAPEAPGPAPAADAPAAPPGARAAREVEAPALTPAEREAHYRALGTDPAIGNAFRRNEADTAMRLEQSRGIHLERYEPGPGQKGDWYDTATNQVYDGCSPPPTAHFDRQMVPGGRYEQSLREHLEHPTVNFVVVDVSGLNLAPAQLQHLDELLARVAGPNNPKIVRLP
jgi:hypothetical protein